MKPIQDLLNKIKWTGEDITQYTLGVYDRVQDKIIEIPLKDITVEHNILIVMQNGRHVDIPFHRIRKVWKNKELLWAR